MHYAPLHYTALHHTTLHYTTLHYTAVHYTTPHHTTLRFSALHHCTTPHHTTHLLNISHAACCIVARSEQSCFRCVVWGGVDGGHQVGRDREGARGAHEQGDIGSSEPKRLVNGFGIVGRDGVEVECGRWGWHW